MLPVVIFDVERTENRIFDRSTNGIGVSKIFLGELSSSW